MEGDNGGRPSLGWMGVYLVEKSAGIWKYHRDLSDV